MGKAEELWGSGGKSSWACSAPGEMVPPIGGDGIQQLLLGVWRDIRSEEGWKRNIHIGLELARVDLEGRGIAGEGWVFAGLEGVDKEGKKSQISRLAAEVVVDTREYRWYESVTERRVLKQRQKNLSKYERRVFTDDEAILIQIRGSVSCKHA